MTKPPAEEARKPEPIDLLMNVIRTWIDTESGPTQMTITNTKLKVQLKFHGYKKLILERKFDD